MSVLFSIGEATLSRNPDVARTFAVPAQRWPLIQTWTAHAIAKVTERRRGDAAAIQLATGQLLTASDVPAQLQPIFKLLLRAQSTGAPDDLRATVDAFVAVPAFRARMNEAAALLASMYCAPEIVPMQKVWESFFSCCFRVAEESLLIGDLSPNDVAEQEPWLYLGLTAATALDCVTRSPPTGPLRLAFGELDVTEANVPPEGKEFFDAFVRLRDGLAHAKLDAGTIALLRRRVLWNDRTDRAVALPGVLAPFSGALLSIAVRASQEPTYKANFQNTLDLLAAVLPDVPVPDVAAAPLSRAGTTYLV